ncbi:SIR2 family NAD-dependent protein deacylase [Nannocystis radixulma]|uniref:SIR2 family protein n=1 Tax=Nannocystis radixulma TaxID=2995305 RepID=A0ABT5BF60_9BACT|nr:SIR2 family protein [Nannocystis radixulma]MDC0672250.1 SIR2 family protein [Nannocystis radixulma]
MPGDVHRALVALDVDVLLTTNYDLYELAQPGRQAYTWRQSDKALGDIDDGSAVLFKIHGSAEDDESVVMTRDEYDKGAANASARDTMRCLLQAYTFLLVGYGINDPLDLDLVFGLNKAAFGSATRRHYALMPKSAPPNERARWDRDMNIQAIPYDDHGDLPAILRELAKTSRSLP